LGEDVASACGRNLGKPDECRDFNLVSCIFNEPARIVPNPISGVGGLAGVNDNNLLEEEVVLSPSSFVPASVSNNVLEVVGSPSVTDAASDSFNLLEEEVVLSPSSFVPASVSNNVLEVVGSPSVTDAASDSFNLLEEKVVVPFSDWCYLIYN